eukprot:13484361-Alexandrium_andersonii.AAC.1
MRGMFIEAHVAKASIFMRVVLSNQEAKDIGAILRMKTTRLAINANSGRRSRARWSSACGSSCATSRP